MKNGWVKVHRKFEHKGYYKDSHYVHLWLHCLFRANFEPQEILHNGEIMKLKRGQFLTGRKALSRETGISESKVQRILKTFESEQQIEQQMFAKFRVISVLKYNDYQLSEQQIEQHVNSTRTAREQHVNTEKERKKEKKVRNKNYTVGQIKNQATEIINYLNKKTGKDFRPTETNVKLISGRMSEGFTAQDFMKVIDIKVTKWKGDPKMDDFLRPTTLFCKSKFESYLNESPVQNLKKRDYYAKDNSTFDEFKGAGIKKGWYESGTSDDVIRSDYENGKIIYIGGRYL